MISSERGSVTVFIMIILSVFLLLFAVLFDFIRIRQADTQARQAVNAASRSVLSAYDQELFERYGLFALTLDEAGQKEIAEQVLTGYYTPDFQQRSSDNNMKTLQMSRSALLGLELSTEKPLSETAVLYDQILQDMKYKAPVEFSLEVLEHLRKPSISGQAQKTTTHYRQLEELEGLIKLRDQHLDSYGELVRQQVGSSGTTRRHIQQAEQQLQDLYQLALRIGNWDASSAGIEKALREQEYQELRNSVDVLTDQILELQALSDQDEQGEQEDEDLQILKEQLKETEQEQRKVRQALDDWLDKISDIAAYGLQLILIKEQLKHTAEGFKDFKSQALKQLQLAEGYHTQLEGKWQALNDGVFQQAGNQETLRKMQQDWMVDGSYWHKKELVLAKSMSLLHSMEQRFEPEKLLPSQQFLTNRDSILNRLQSARSSVEQLYRAEREDQQRRKQQIQQMNEQQEEHTSKLTEILGEIKELMSKCQGTEGIYYAELMQIQQRLKNHQETAESESVKEDDVSMGWMDEVNGESITEQSVLSLEGMQSVFYSVRDHIYLNEYILQRFDFRTKDKNQAFTPLRDQEAEYLLYGLPSCMANQGAAVMEIFVFRMGIRTAEALADPKKLATGAASPLTSFLWAASQGASKALKDTQKLVNGKKVAISEKWASQWQLDYEDYLRLFFTLHPFQEKKLQRTQALIALNTSTTLEQAVTSVELSSTTVTSLLFLPTKKKEMIHSSTLSY